MKTPIQTDGAPAAIGTYSQAVRAGDTVRARATITEIVQDKRRVAMSTICSVGDKVVIEGDALIMVPTRRR